MNRERTRERLISAGNVWILLVIALLYVVTGTRTGDDAIAAFSRGTIYRGRADDAVALMCAVTWDASALTDMLDTLEQNDVKITFFVSGKWANAHAKTLMQMAEAGHEIGACGYEPTLDGDCSLIEKDVAASVGVIERITGKPVRYYYAGLREPSVSARAAKSQGLVCVKPSFDLLSAGRTADELVSMAEEKAFGGSIFLMQPTQAAQEALQALLQRLWENGYDTVSVGMIQKESG